MDIRGRGGTAIGIMGSVGLCGIGGGDVGRSEIKRGRSEVMRKYDRT